MLMRQELTCSSSVERGYPHRDPPLTEAGEIAAKGIRPSTVPDLIIISPMTRTIQTAEIAFGSLIEKLPTQVDIQVWPELREADDSICNKGVSRAAMIAKFPQMNFDKCPEQWNHPPHSTEGATVRAETVRKRLKQLTTTYKNIALITHKGFISFLIPGEKFDVCGEFKGFELQHPLLPKLTLLRDSLLQIRLGGRDCGPKIRDKL